MSDTQDQAPSAQPNQDQPQAAAPASPPSTIPVQVNGRTVEMSLEDAQRHAAAGLRTHEESQRLAGERANLAQAQQDAERWKTFQQWAQANPERAKQVEAIYRGQPIASQAQRDADLDDEPASQPAPYDPRVDSHERALAAMREELQGVTREVTASKANARKEEMISRLPDASEDQRSVAGDLYDKYLSVDNLSHEEAQALVLSTMQKVAPSEAQREFDRRTANMQDRTLPNAGGSPGVTAEPPPKFEQSDYKNGSVKKHLKDMARKLGVRGHGALDLPR